MVNTHKTRRRTSFPGQQQKFIVGVALMGVALCVRVLLNDAIVLLIGDCYVCSARTNYPLLHCVVCDRSPPLMSYGRCH